MNYRLFLYTLWSVSVHMLTYAYAYKLVMEIEERRIQELGSFEPIPRDNSLVNMRRFQELNNGYIPTGKPTQVLQVLQDDCGWSCDIVTEQVQTDSAMDLATKLELTQLVLVCVAVQTPLLQGTGNVITMPACNH